MIQLAFLGHNLYETEYSDASGYFRTTNVDLDLSAIKQLFEGFLNGSSDWKNLTQWTLVAEAVRTAIQLKCLNPDLGISLIVKK